MTTLTELREKRGKLVTDARAALEEIKANTTEDRAKELDERHDKIMADLDKLDAQIAREQKLADIEARDAEERAKQRPTPKDTTVRGQDEGAKPEYRDAFAKLLCGMLPSEMPAEYRDVIKANMAKFEGRAQSTSNSAGGYTVPVTLANFIVRSMLMWGPMYDEALCTVITTSSGEQINIPTIDDTAVTVAKHTEGTALTDDGSKDVTVGQKVLNAYVFDTTFVKWSMELAADSNFNWEQLLGELLGERLGRRANVELTTGDGSGDPNGIVTASSLGVTAAASTALTTDELMDLQHSVDPAYRASFADGSSLDVHTEAAAMTAAVEEFAGPDQAAGYQRLRDWLTELYRLEMNGFIASNFEACTSTRRAAVHCWPEMMVAEAFTKFKETGINKGGRQIYPHRWRIAIHRTAEDQETITYQLTATSLANPPEATQVHPLIIEKLTHGVEPRDELSRIARSHAEWMSRQNDGIWPEAGTTQY